MPIGLNIQKAVRKPLIYFSKFLHFSGLASMYNQFITPVNRYLFFTSPYLKSFNFDYIIDVGANSGEFILLMQSNYGSIPLLAFEPIKKEFEGIKNKFSKNENIQIINEGLGSNIGSVDLYVGEFSPSSSILKPETKNYSVETIKINKLDNYIEKFSNKNNILLKIDVEGFEMEVLKGSLLSLKCLNLIYIEARTTDIVGCSFDDIYLFLTTNGFKYLGNYDTTFKKNGEISHFDSMFIRI